MATARQKQTIPAHLRFTIFDFNKRFPTDDACLEELMQMRFPDGIAYCPKCHEERKHYRITGRPVYGCAWCGNQISPMAGTVFEHSSTPLRLWFYAMYLMASTRCGISAKQIQRETGVTYKTAWRMFRQIRSLLGEDSFSGEGSYQGKLTRKVEVDESYFGGRRKGYGGRKLSADKGTKTIVVGVAQRKGRVKAVVATDASAATLKGVIRQHVLPGSTVFTDEWSGYNEVRHLGMAHHRISHSEKIYVSGDVHTNTIEGFWALVKNGIRGVYHQVGRNYLQSYLNEYSFRYNRRNQGNLIFNDVLRRVGELAQERPSESVCQTPLV
jgi:transposase